MIFQRSTRTMCALACLLALMVAGTARADDWPQWRGPRRDGIWREDGLVQKFSAARIKPLWRVEISSGYCGPTVADGRVVVMDRVAKEKEQSERVLCFDAKTGRHLWTHRYPCVYENVGYRAGPRASVSLHQGRAYTLGTMGHAHCIDAASGKIVWSKDLNTQFKIRMPIWGVSASPLIYQDLMIAQIGGSDGACLVALELETGKLRWKALDDRASYAAPIVIQQMNQDVLVCWTGAHVAGLNPISGRVHWKHPFKPRRMVLNVATPVVDQNHVFVTGFYDGSLMLRLHQDRLAVDKVWRRAGRNERNTDSLHSIMATPILEGKHLYGVDSYGELRCLETQTGDRVWTDKTATRRARWSNIHMVRNGERTWMFNESGELLIARLTPKGFQEISRAKLIEPTTDQLRQRGGVCWAHPAFANRCVFVRNDRALVCASLAAEK